MRTDLLQLGVRSPIHVAEVFSYPGNVCSCPQIGLALVLALDMRIGWDLNDPAHRAKVWSHLQHERPTLIAQVDTYEIDDLTSTVGKFHKVVSFCMNSVECC